VRRPVGSFATVRLGRLLAVTLTGLLPGLVRAPGALPIISRPRGFMLMVPPSPSVFVGPAGNRSVVDIRHLRHPQRISFGPSPRVNDAT
jgi:hypothetical protein